MNLIKLCFLNTGLTGIYYYYLDNHNETTEFISERFDFLKVCVIQMRRIFMKCLDKT